jgi:transposase
MKKKLPSDWREARRLRAWELKGLGWKPVRIAEALGVTRGAVSQWFKKAEAEGIEALYSRKASGPKPRLSDEQMQQLPELLDKGPEAHGFRGDVWTCKRVGKVIERHFGETYTPQYVGKLLHKIGWSRQKPVKRAKQRNEVAIEQWRTERWPLLKKKPNKKTARSSS